jgi:hypothetical protein
MAVRYTLPNGIKVEGPPFTKAEIREMHRRMQNGPRLMVMPGRRLAVPADPTAAASGYTSPGKPERSRSAADVADPASSQDPPTE